MTDAPAAIVMRELEDDAEQSASKKPRLSRERTGNAGEAHIESNEGNANAVVASATDDLLSGLGSDVFASLSDWDECGAGGSEAKRREETVEVFMDRDAEYVVTGRARGEDVLPSSQPSEEVVQPSQASQSLQPTPNTVYLRPSSFLTASGVALPPVSDTARDKAEELFQVELRPEDTFRQSAYAIAGRSALEPLSENSVRQAEASFIERAKDTAKGLDLEPIDLNPSTTSACQKDSDCSAVPTAQAAEPGRYYGFTTALGKPLTPPSADSKARLDALWACEDGEPSLGIASSPSRQIQAGSSCVIPIKIKPKANEDDEYDVFGDDDLLAADTLNCFSASVDPSITIPAVVSFISAGKKPLKVPSAEAWHKAQKIVEEEGLGAELVSPDALVEAAAAASSAAVSTMTPQVSRTLELSTGDWQTLKQQATELQLSTTINSASSLPSHFVKDVVAVPSVTPQRPKRNATSVQSPYTTPRPAPFHSPAPSRPASTQGTNETPVRIPLRVTTNTLPRRPATPLVGAKTMFKTPLQTPLRRVGLGVTPRSRGTKGSPGFTVPFLKNKKDGAGGPLQSPSMRKVTVAKALPVFVPPTPVFDLSPPGLRKTMKESFFHPHYSDKEELIERGVPIELFEIDITNAEYYAFKVDDAYMDVAAAHKLLLENGCSLVNFSWVLNHWSLILWKLAAQVRARPEILGEKWQWQEVVNQLKYRYEREFNHAQRSLIKRIQERDAAAGLPMHLCVTSIQWPDSDTEAEPSESPVSPVLELTDGWYRIKARTDAALATAVRCGRIKIGYKLAISGARLDSNGEGHEVLKALDMSRLLISGNSASLARWHVRLGQQSRPFVATIRSLTPSGGVIALMDVRITRVFPLAFVDGSRGSTAGPWGADEEAALQDQWERSYNEESIRLQDELNKRLEKLEDLVDNLSSSISEEIEVLEEEQPADLEDRFEALLHSRNFLPEIRQYSNHEAAHLAQYGRSYLENERLSGADDVQQELQNICAPRNVRNFRIVRFEDSLEYHRRIKDRTAQLCVWDAQALGDDAILQGQRYMISNLIPSQHSSWSPTSTTSTTGEIYLNTRRDTRWQVIEE